MKATTTDACLRLRPGYRAVPSTDGVVLASERGGRMLADRRYRHIFARLDGTSTLAELEAQLEGTVPSTDVRQLVTALIQSGHLVDAPPRRPEAESGYWAQCGVADIDADTRLRAATVHLRMLGNVDDGPVRAALADVGIRVADPCTPSSIELVLTDDPIRDELGVIDARARASGRRWMLARLVGARLWIGPLFGSQEGPCWQCLAHRVRQRRRLETWLRAHTDPGTPPAPVVHAPGSEHIGARLLASTLAKVVTSARGRLGEDELLTFDVVTLQLQRHPVVRRPRCAGCGSPRDSGALPPVPPLDGDTPLASHGGGWRAVSPETTIERLRRNTDALTGVVDPPVRISGDRDGLTPIYIAHHGFAPLDGNVPRMDRNVKQAAGGKGSTDAQARASAMCEAIERASGAFLGDEPRRRATARELGALAIPVPQLVHVSARQLALRERWNQTAEPKHRVPEPFSPDQTLDWSPVWSLTKRQWQWVPTSWCYYGHPEARDPAMCWADSNGCAAGNHLEEAVLQGFLEVVERDAVAMWWMNRLRRPGIDLDGIDDSYVQQLRTHYARQGRTLWALDLTHDLGVTTVAAISTATDRPTQDVLYGFGSHFDPAVALRRALTEVNQSLPIVADRNPDGTTRYRMGGGGPRKWWREVTTETEPWLLPDPDVALRPLSALPLHACTTLGSAVQRCRRQVEACGLEMLVLDMTRPDVGLPVAKVIVPGLRHFWHRVGPGRLFDVPVALGWLDTPRTEAQLNPWTIYF
ncbi:MAG: TOMM precursor leader peptide-binding protein [Deltaproteobacteria bacterium]|nr:TOMM precursor leader peptide-binding protein [Deltaproteobacteria bacterium]